MKVKHIGLPPHATSELEGGRSFTPKAAPYGRSAERRRNSRLSTRNLSTIMTDPQRPSRRILCNLSTYRAHMPTLLIGMGGGHNDRDARHDRAMGAAAPLCKKKPHLSDAARNLLHRRRSSGTIVDGRISPAHDPSDPRALRGLKALYAPESHSHGRAFPLRRADHYQCGFCCGHL